MSVTKIKPVQSLRHLVNYLQHGHCSKSNRIVAEYSDFGGISNYLTLSEELLATVPHKRKLQGFHLIQGFAPGEVASAEQANQLGVLLATKLYDGFPFIVATHLEPKNNASDETRFANHIAITSFDLCGTAGHKYGYSLQQNKAHFLIAKANDAIMRMSNIPVTKRKDASFSQKAYWDQKRGSPYIWEEDLIVRLNAVEEAGQYRNIGEYQDKCAELGVSVWQRGKTLTYSFLDADGTQRKRRGNKISPRFDLPAVQAQIMNNQITMQSTGIITNPNIPINESVSENTRRSTRAIKVREIEKSDLPPARQRQLNLQRQRQQQLTK